MIWWRDNLEAWNGKALVSREPDLIIETDASRKGWGASCMGQTTGGRWSLQEQHFHINCLCGQQRLEIRTPSVRQSKSGLGPPRGRSICHSSVKTAPPLRQLETGSRGRVGQCVGSRLEQFSRLRISLVGRWLKQMLTQNVPTLVLIAPVWRTQPWYPLLLELSMAPHRLLPPIPGLLTKIQEVHPLTNLQLAG